MLRVRAFAYDLALRHTFTISRGSTDVQPTMIVELRDGAGRSGYGEATTNDYYGFTLDSMAATLAAARSAIESDPFDTPEAMWDRLRACFANDAFAQCAVDQAAWDLWGKQRGKPLHQLWNLDPDDAPPTDYTIGIDTIERMVAKMDEFPGWPIYKIKLGTPDDLRIVRALRERTAATFRVDANCAWTADETIRNAASMRELGVEFIEQPLPADEWDAMRRVFSESVLPILADESCIVEPDVDRCAGHFHGVNIKLVKCGGLTPARRMIDRARQIGLRVMVGCMTESSVGISAIGQLAPLLDYVDMDGALLLAEDIAEGVGIECGRCRFPSTGGSGVRLIRPGRPMSV
ncbi:MAG: dipeptide epimerase [Planctomycetes bacterium]|nr:dipeptide epimerase [Planctomycetota bacterium]